MTDRALLGTSFAPSFAVLVSPGDVLKAPLLSLEFNGVSKVPFRLTALPLFPLTVPGLGVLGTRLSSLEIL